MWGKRKHVLGTSQNSRSISKIFTKLIGRFLFCVSEKPSQGGCNPTTLKTNPSGLHNHVFVYHFQQTVEILGPKANRSNQLKETQLKEIGTWF
jgi:hypothetical protein